MNVLSKEMEHYISQRGFREALAVKMADPQRKHDGFLPSQDEINRECVRLDHLEELKRFDEQLTYLSTLENKCSY